MGKQYKEMADVELVDLVDLIHPPVYERRALKAGVAIKFGQVAKLEADGTLNVAATGETPYGIACETAEAGTYATVLIHGTCKASKVLVGSAAITDADVKLLKAEGVYVLN